jgi:hypothetical protein
MRTCHPTFLQTTYHGFYILQRRTIELILGQHPSDIAWSQASLPISMDGVGLRSAEAHSAAAFVASVSQIAPLVSKLLPDIISGRESNNAFTLLQKASGDASWTSFEMLPLHYTRHDLSLEIEKSHLASLPLVFPLVTWLSLTPFPSLTVATG